MSEGALTKYFDLPAGKWRINSSVPGFKIAAVALVDLRAGRAAGFGGDDATVRMQVSRALHNQKVQDALREVGGKLIRASAFTAIRQTEKIANDIEHRDCLKACLALMDRGGFAVETHHTVTVEHKSLDDQALEALRTMCERRRRCCQSRSDWRNTARSTGLSCIRNSRKS